MTEELVDPRHSAAFQRGYASSSPLSGQFSPSRPGALATPPPVTAAPVAPATQDRRRSAPPVARPIIADPFEAVVDVPPSETAVSIPVDASVMANDRARRSFLGWTIALFAIGAVLCILSFAIFYEFNYSRWSSVESSTPGEYLVRASDGSTLRTISEFEYMTTMFLMQNASWLGVIGLLTIVGNLFRIAPRRPRA